MALRNLENAVFVDGILISGSWTPSEPRKIYTSRELSKNRYTIYPFIKDDLDGTAEFVELTNTVTYERVALTLDAAAQLQNAIDAVAISEDENRITTGRYREENRIVGSYVHETTVQTKREVLVEWTEGPPEEEGA